MPSLRFLLYNALEVARAVGPFDRDSVTAEDPLPLIVETRASGCALVRDTRITRVAPETTDDK